MDFKYRAFISYSHADHGWAVWLHKALETYKVPKQVVGLITPAGTVPKKLGRVYRDEAEEGAASELGPRIEAALETADAQIIIASPKSAKSQWVDKEVRKFKSLGREHRIFVLIVDGEPHAKDVDQDCFVDALKWKTGPDGELSDEPAEPLAVDVRKFGKHDALVRIVSGILGLGYDDLKQRDLLRQRAERRRNEALFAGALVLFAGAVVASALSIGQTKNVADRESLLFADRARQYNENADHRRGLLWSLGGLPHGSMLIKPDATEARAQVIRAWQDNKTLNTSRVMDAAYDRTGDRLVTVTDDRTEPPVIWDARTGERLTTLDLSELTGDEISISRLQFMADEDFVAGLQWQGPVVIWDAATGQLVKTFGEKIEDFLLYADDTRLLTYALLEREAYIWNVETGERLHTLGGHRWDIIDIDASDDGRVLYTSEFFRSVFVWDGLTGELRYLLDGNADMPQLSRDGRFLAAQNIDTGITVYDAASGEVIETPEADGYYFTPIKFSPDGSYLIYEVDGRVGYWDTYYWDDTPLPEPESDSLELSGPVNLADYLLFTADGSRLYYLNLSGKADMWDMATGTRLGTIINDDIGILDYQGNVITAVLNPAGDQLFSSYVDAPVQLWDLGRRQEQKILPIPREDETAYSSPPEVLGFSLSPDGNRIATRSYQTADTIWDLETGELVYSIPHEIDSGLTPIFSPDGKTLLTAGVENTIVIRNSGTGEEVRRLPGQNNLITGFTFSPDGSRILSGNLSGYGSQGSVKMWDAATGQELFSAQSIEARTLQFTPDGNRFLTVGLDGAALHDTATGEVISTMTLPIVEYDTTGDAVSDDTSLLMMGARDSTVYVFDVETGALLHTLEGHFNEVYGGAFSPDKSLLATYGSDNTVIVWDLETGKQRHMLWGEREAFGTVAFSADSSRLVTGSFDNLVLLWDMQTGQLLARFDGHTNEVWASAFTPDDRYLITGSRDGTMRLWNSYGDLTGKSLSALYSEGCARLEVQGVTEFDINTPMLSAMAPGDRQLLSPCDRRGLLSGDWWGPTLQNWWATLLPGSTE